MYKVAQTQCFAYLNDLTGISCTMGISLVKTGKGIQIIKTKDLFETYVAPLSSPTHFFKFQHKLTDTQSTRSFLKTALQSEWWQIWLHARHWLKDFSETSESVLNLIRNRLPMPHPNLLGKITLFYFFFAYTRSTSFYFIYSFSDIPSTPHIFLAKPACGNMTTKLQQCSSTTQMFRIPLKHLQTLTWSTSSDFRKAHCIEWVIQIICRTNLSFMLLQPIGLSLGETVRSG